MVAELVRLKLALLRNSLKRSVWQMIGLILGGLYGLGILGLILFGLVTLGFADPELAHTILVLAGSLVILGWMIVPLVASGVDMTLDPARFVTFSVPMNTLIAGLTAAGLVGIPGVVTLIASLGTAAVWWRNPASLIAALICAVVAVLTCVVFSRLVTTATTSLSASRRFKDVSGIVAFIPLILLGPIITASMTGIRNVQDLLPALAETMSWTPLGAVWSVPGDVALGHSGQAVLKFLIAVATLALALWLWKVLLAKALVTPVHQSVNRRTAGKLGFFGLFPGTPAGAVAARSLTYWFRDPRYGASLIVIPLLPVILWFSASQSGSLGLLNILGPVTAFLLAWSISADISYDNTAFSQHVSTGVNGVADRIGRAVACGLVALPICLLFVLGTAWINSGWAQLPALAGLTLGTLLSGLGLSSVISARFTYNVPLPGDSPFKTPPGSGMQMFVVQMGGWLVLGVLIMPELILAIVAFTTGKALFAWLTLAVGMILGSVFLIVGIRMGGRWFDNRTPELLSAVSMNR